MLIRLCKFVWIVPKTCFTIHRMLPSKRENSFFEKKFSHWTTSYILTLDSDMPHICRTSLRYFFTTISYWLWHSHCRTQTAIINNRLAFLEAISIYFMPCINNQALHLTAYSHDYCRQFFNDYVYIMFFL